jgi:hypothetical protein
MMAAIENDLKSLSTWRYLFEGRKAPLGFLLPRTRLTLRPTP